MNQRYIKNLGALTEEECALLGSRRAAVIGCGGLGGYAVELLTRIGVGALRLVDGDVFEESNLNRQLLCRESSIGKSKAEAAGERVAEINSTVKTEIRAEFLTESSADRLIEDCDVVIDALDDIKTRRILADACSRAGITLVHGAVSGWLAQIAVLKPGSRLLDRLYPQDSVPDCGTPSFTPALAASIQAAEAVRVLVGRESSLLGKVLLIDLLQHSFDIVEL